MSIYDGPWNDPDVKWVCEKHPNKLHQHRIFGLFECGGAGMMDEKSRIKYGKMNSAAYEAGVKKGEAR